MPYKDLEKRRECARLSRRKAYKLHPETFRQQSKKWKESHPDMVLAQRKRWREKHKSQIAIKYRLNTKKRRKIVIEHYGGKCSCCGESQYEFLTIEHKNGGGTKHRKLIGPANISKWIIENNFPPEFDVLCYNCNCAKAYSGVCPHQK